MSLKIRSILVLVIGTVLGLSLSFGGAVIASREAVRPDPLSLEQAELIAEVLERVKRDYVEPIDEQKLFDSAIRGMVAELDAHSQYLDESEYQDIRVSTSGSYSGVGLELGTRKHDVIVIAPIDGSPAERAGIRSGDSIIAINDTPVDAETLHSAIHNLRGRPGSGVSLTVVRGADEKVLVFDLRRENVRVASVMHEVLEPSFGYARISQFTDSTASELAGAIDAMIDELGERDGELAGLVLDLRNNPGGILDAAVDVSDLFLDSGIIVTADGRTPEARFSKSAHRGDILDGAPIVVLVNRGSASASEIVAGALQDHHRALLVGTSTYGKGLVQTVMPLSRGRAIKLTTSRYYTPSGGSINKIGIAPDVLIEDDGEHPGFDLHGIDREGDQQLIEALERLKDRRILHSRAS